MSKKILIIITAVTIFTLSIFTLSKKVSAEEEYTDFFVDVTENYELQTIEESLGVNDANYYFTIQGSILDETVDYSKGYFVVFYGNWINDADVEINQYYEIYRDGGIPILLTTPAVSLEIADSIKLPEESYTKYCVYKSYVQTGKLSICYAKNNSSVAPEIEEEIIYKIYYFTGDLKNPSQENNSKDFIIELIYEDLVDSNNACSLLKTGISHYLMKYIKTITTSDVIINSGNDENYYIFNVSKNELKTILKNDLKNKLIDSYTIRYIIYDYAISEQEKGKESGYISGYNFMQKDYTRRLINDILSDVVTDNVGRPILRKTSYGYNAMMWLINNNKIKNSKLITYVNEYNYILFENLLNYQEMESALIFDLDSNEKTQSSVLSSQNYEDLKKYVFEQLIEDERAEAEASGYNKGYSAGKKKNQNVFQKLGNLINRFFKWLTEIFR